MFDGYDTLKDTLIMANELIKSMTPNRNRMLKMANEGYTTATDLSDYLVREKKLSFREAYNISSKVVNYAEKSKKADQLSLNELKKFFKEIDSKVQKILNVKNSMNSKISHGGTAEQNIQKRC